MSKPPKLDKHNNSFGSQNQPRPMPRGFDNPNGVVIQRRNDGHSGGTGIGLEAANFHDPMMAEEEDEVTYDYGYYGENDRL